MLRACRVLALASAGESLWTEGMTLKMEQDLTGQLLIAMPGIGDPRFESAVVFMCAHTPEGAMGLIVNRVSEGVDVADVFEQLEIARSPSMVPMSVHFGGPVEMGRGFVLHTTDYEPDHASMPVRGGYAMTASREILRDLGRGAGPRRALLCLGYAGWGPGQLEEELGANGWLTCPADEAIVFEALDDDKWQAALGSIGVSPALLSGEAGHA